MSEFESLVEAYETDLFTFCNYLTHGDNDTTSDLYQDTVLYAFEIRHKIDKTNNPKSFLFSIAAGKYKNLNKKTKNRSRLIPQLPLGEYLDTASDIFNEPENTLLMQESSRLIHSTLLTLKDKFRIPLILFYFDDLSIEDIASILAIPKGTVKSRLHKGRELIKSTLEKEGYPNEY